ncbi:MAG: DUF5686 and carboxypeptidase regulatory-like domain-containing protein [Chitinophagales bacterium]
MKIFSIVLLCFSSQIFAAEIYGTVKDIFGTPLPYANIYIKGTSTGCATNENGFYSFQVEKGNYLVVFQYIGYKKKEIEVLVKEERVELNVQLEEETTLLDDVIIEDGEDPAYRIMREVIARREKHLLEIQSFSCDVYMKGLQEITFVPEIFKTPEVESVFDLDSNGTGVVYLSESSSLYFFQYPGKIKEVMYASKRSGDNTQFSWNDARGMQFNIYENDLNWQGLSERNFVSPIANNAMFFYEYELLGSITENNQVLYKIKVSPKRKTDPVFSGELYIVSNDYRIYSHQLSITKENGIEFIDTFSVKQQYVPVENRWAVISTQYTFKYNVFGIRGKGYAHAFYKDYIFDPVFEQNFFNAEIARIEEKANEKDSIYWDSIRPVPLTETEVFDYRLKDSIYALKNTDAYKDSLDRVLNKLKPGNLLTGYSYRNSKKDVVYSTPGIADIIAYNTVQGYSIQPELRITKNWENERQLTLQPSLQYGFASETFIATGYLKYIYQPMRFAYFEISGGKDFTQINEKGIGDGLNSSYTLLLEKNFLKLYHKNFLSVSNSIELINGLYFQIHSEYARRKQLWNAPSINPYFDFETKTFTSNNFPFLEDTAMINFSDKFILGGNLKYIIAQKYTRIPNRRYVSEAKYPTLQLSYEKAIPGVLKSAVSYDYLEFKIEDIIKLNLAGNLQYAILTGNYFNERNLGIMDIKHFEGNETIFSRFSSTSFFNLPYYSFSTSEAFVEIHTSYHTEGFLFNKLPLFKQLKIQPVFTFNALFAGNSLGSYYEFATGVEHLFKVLRLDVSYTPKDFTFIYPETNPFRFTIGLGF